MNATTEPETIAIANRPIVWSNAFCLSESFILDFFLESFFGEESATVSTLKCEGYCLKIELIDATSWGNQRVLHIQFLIVNTCIVSGTGFIVKSF